MNPNQTFTHFQTTFFSATTSVLETIIVFLPQLLAAIVILFLGSLFARWIKSIIVRALKTVKLSSVLRDTKTELLLSKVDLGFKFEEVLGELVKWLVMIVFFITAMNMVGLTTVSDFMIQLLGYLPKLLSASLIFVIGVLSAGFVENLVKSLLSGVDRTTSRIIAKASSYIVMVFTTLIVLSEIGIASEFVQIMFSGFVGMMALALGLSFGLGSKDIVRQLLERWYKSLSEDIGE